MISHLINGGDPELSVSTLADQLEWSTSHASRIITELEAYGCVQTNQNGREKLVLLRISNRWSNSRDSSRNIAIWTYRPSSLALLSPYFRTDHRLNQLFAEDCVLTAENHTSQSV
ncbi:MarR family transcriptional regulator [Halorubrum sp. 2020YC2]|nr:MarR family transcriptional regulator [Halorubrum sp. 2020YC2]